MPADSAPAIPAVDPTIVSKFRTRRRLLTAAVAVWILLGAAVYFNPWAEQHDSLVFNVSVIVGIAWMIVVLWKWRCPKCHRYLAGNYEPKFCPGCGVRLLAP